MPTVTLTVKYVNPPKPGKKCGNIKDTDDQLFWVFPDKLRLFEAGKTYEVEYTSKDSNGVTYHTVKGATPLASIAPNNSTSSNGSTYRETSARDAERMWVCSILNAGIKSQQVEFNRQRIEAAVQMLRGVWQQTFGREDTPQEPARETVAPSRAANGSSRPRQDMRDEIPY